jgi:hypothetical protein
VNLDLALQVALEKHHLLVKAAQDDVRDIFNACDVDILLSDDILARWQQQHRHERVLDSVEVFGADETAE